MAYKFQRGAAVASGSFTAEEGLTASTGGLTVSAGTSALQAVTATTVTGSGLAQFQSLTVDGTSIFASVDINGGTIDGATIATSNITVGSGKTLDVSAGTLTLAAGQVGADKVGAGTFNAGTYSFAGSTITSIPAVTQFTASNSSLGAAVASSLNVDSVSLDNNILSGLTELTSSNSSLGVAVATSLSSSGFVQVGQQLTVGQLATLNSGLTITLGGATITGSILHSGNQSTTGRVSAATLTASIGSTLGAAVVTTITGSGAATFASLTVDSVDINGGTIDGTTIGATVQSSVKATSLSASSTLDVAGAATLNNGLTVTSGDSSLQKLTVNGDLIVLGTTFSASVGNLLIEDKQIVLADGAPNAAAAYGAGFFVSGANVEWTFKQNGEGSAASSGDIFVASSSAGLIDIQAANFYGTFNGAIATTVNGVGNADANLVTGVNYGTANLTAPRAWTLPSSPVVGDSVRIKAPSNCDSTNYITVQKDAGTSHTIDGETFVVLESNWAAIECIYVASNLWRIF